MKLFEICIIAVITMGILSGCDRHTAYNESISKEAASNDNIYISNNLKEESFETAEDLPTVSDFINSEGNNLRERFIAPEGYKRVEVDDGSFAQFLRNYPLEPDKSPVYYFDKREKPGNGHAAVFSMEVAEEDLQQCADSVMRIYAEYLYKTNQQEKIKFHFVDGFLCDFLHWSQGYRVKFSGETAHWEKATDFDGGEESFKKYLHIVFAYSSTLSMEKEAVPVSLSQIQAGDIFINGGSPGHVVMIADICENDKGEKAFLLAQGFMPAQSFHIIKNPAHPENPWYYEKEVTYPFRTENYSFSEGSLMRPVYLKP